MPWDLSAWRAEWRPEGIAVTSPRGERTVVARNADEHVAGAGLTGALDRLTQGMDQSTERTLRGAAGDEPSPAPSGRLGRLADRAGGAVSGLTDGARVGRRLAQGTPVLVTLPDGSVTSFHNGRDGYRRSLATATMTLGGRTYVRRPTGGRTAEIRRDDAVLATAERGEQDRARLDERPRFVLQPVSGLEPADELAVMILCEACGPVGADGFVRNTVNGATIT